MSEKTQNGFLHYLGQAWLVLLLAVGFGVALAGVEGLTRPRIRKNRKDLIARRLVEMFGEGPTTTEARVLEGIVDGRSRKIECYPAIRGGQQVGWGVLAEGKGYDTLLLLVAVDLPCRKLVGYRVIKSLETPGIGDRIETPAFSGQFAGKSAAVWAEPLEPVGPDAEAAGQQVHSISGATISSQGVVKTINDSLAAVGEKLAALAAEAR